MPGEVLPESVELGERYELVRILGEGGMGTVYLARQHEPVRRQVALKVIKRGMESDQVVARFETERQALAQMDHPAIARVYDAGQMPSGQPFLSLLFPHSSPLRFAPTGSLASEGTPPATASRQRSGRPTPRFSGREAVPASWPSRRWPPAIWWW